MTDNEQISEDQHLAQTLGSEGWKIAMQSFDEKVMDLQSVMNIDASKPEDVVSDIKARRTAIGILLEWRKELIARTERHLDRPQESEGEDFIRRQ